LETAVLLELERRGATIGYLRTTSGYEIDFHAQLPDGTIYLIQVCAELGHPDTLTRELRALAEARVEHPQAQPLLISADLIPPPGIPAEIPWQSAAAWLLGDPLAG
jgi:predicted AAA+ superfamily ATPase